jgi:protein deglycase
MSKSVLVPMSDGVEELEAVTIIDVLRRCGADVTVAGVGGVSITASRGVKLSADVSIHGCLAQSYDLIALPGGLPGAEHLRDCDELIEMLKSQDAAGRLYAAICASPAVVLEYHGLLEGKKATCYPAMLDKLGDKGVDEPVVEDGNCITSQGPGTAMAFALALASRLYGKEAAGSVAQGLLFDKR